LGNRGSLYRKYKQARQGSVRFGLARELCPASTLCMEVSWCAVIFGVAGSDRFCGWLRYLFVLGEASVCVAFCRGRREGCAVGIGVAGGVVLGWLLAFV
jgi:hypothetical protein